jgi:demethylmenaquinone methyltransferase/2-methoxy-6-polyprenyl-1,4-benzoquinol methylase
MPHSPPEDQNNATAHFGFRRVPENQRAGLVRDVFDSVAPRYDLMNDLMSWGIHRLWKAALIDWLRPRPGMTLVDVGGGTGDIALRFLGGGGGAVTVVDANPAMIDQGRDRAIDAGRPSGIDWIVGDAESLPLDDAIADAVTVSFCIRNVTRIPKALAEARRVLKPGGHFLCLEFSQVILPVLDKLYDTYSFKVLPALGELVADNADAYRYLAESIRRFPAQEAFARDIAGAGLERVEFRNLSGGIAAIHSAWRI